MLKTAAIALWFSFLFVCTQDCMGQLYDQNWVVSDSAQIFTFRNDSVIKNIIPQTVYNRDFWASISDENGNFQFFTDGYQAYDKYGYQIANGYDLVDTVFERYYPGGWHNMTGGVILPRGNNKYFYINHSVSDTYFLSTTWQYPDRLYYSEIDMNAELVTSKRNLLYDQPMCNTHITTCRHGNGRDWWLVVNNYHDSTYAKFIVSPDTITGPYFQTIGASYPGLNISGQLMFSPDGSRMAGITASSDLVVLDFDRCSGLFSNPLVITIPNDTMMYYGSMLISGPGGASVMFSPSCRYLYVAREFDLVQYDLQSANVASSMSMIYQQDSFHFGALDVGFLSPNGTIIIENANATHHGFNVIKEPDQPGNLCHFIKEDTNLHVYADVFINQTFNYRLGKKTGSGCDTLSTGINTVDLIKTKLYPNPASESMQLDLYTRDLSEALFFVIYDALGRELLRKEIPLYQLQISRGNLSSGAYIWKIQNNKDQVRAVGKMVWE